MKARIISAVVVVALVLSLVQNVSAGTIEVKDGKFSPDPFKQGDTLHVTAKVTSTADIEYVRLFPCWEKPTYTCGLPADMTDANSDGTWEGDYSNKDWTTGNIIHVEVKAKDKDGIEANLTFLVTVGGGGTGGPSDYTNEGDCKGAGYYWWDDACHENEKQLSDCTDKVCCDYMSGYWYDDKCNADIGTPDKYKDKTTCKEVGFYWYDGKCNKKEKPADGGFIPGFEAAAVLVALASIGVFLRRR